MTSDDDGINSRNVNDGKDEGGSTPVPQSVDSGDNNNNDEVIDDSDLVAATTTMQKTAMEEEDNGDLFQDHYTLQTPSSAVRFRGTSVQVHEFRSSQLQLLTRDDVDDKEEKQGGVSSPDATSPPNKKIWIKKIPNERATGLNLLRLSYTLVAFFYVGILFVLCFQVLLFVFMDLVVDAGLTDDNDGDAAAFVGTLLAIPMFLLGLSSIMTLGAAFLADVWYGHVLWKQVVGSSFWDPLYTEWVTFVALLGIPIVTWSVALFGGSDDWWRITLLTWFCCVTVEYVVFCWTVIYYELEAAWLLLQYENDGGGDTETTGGGLLNRLSRNIFRAIRHRHVFSYSSHTERVRLTHSGAVSEDEDEEQITRTSSWNCWKWLTLSRCCSCCYESLISSETADWGQRVYALPDLLGTRHFVTKHSWSLEKLFCSNQHVQSVVIVTGPSAVTTPQMQSSLACTWLGIGLVVLLCAAGLAWMEASGVFIIVVAALIVVCCCFGRVQSTHRLHQMYKHVREHEAEEHKLKQLAAVDEMEQPVEDVEASGIYQTFERYRVARPKPYLSWFVLVPLEVGLLIVWPLITLFAVGSSAIATLFLVLSLFGITRYYLNPSVLLQELASSASANSTDVAQLFENLRFLQHAQQSSATRGDEEDKKAGAANRRHRQWKAQSRLFTILTHVTRGPSRTVWLYVFFLLAFGVILFTVGALSESAEDSVSDADEIVILPRGQYAYIGDQSTLAYPTCALAKGLEIPNGNVTALADYAFLAQMAYQAPHVWQKKLDEWFGPGVAKDEVEIVLEFRKSIEGGTAAVSYHFVTFEAHDPETVGNEVLGVIVVRGSTTSWEWLTDAQLWSAAALAQMVRGLLPLGEFVTPLIPQLLKGLSVLESESLDEVALYQQTTKFVEFLRSTGNYTKLHITGQSLGGGISLITGAQSQIPAIAISGPNNVLSRKTFDPTFTKDDIKKYLFNVLPERDIVPRVDDVGMQHQEIQCRARKNDLFGCHSSIRSLCEIMYTCGSHNRPPLCECATKFGYPEATPIGDTGNKTFTDFCGTCRTNDGYYSDCS